MRSAIRHLKLRHFRLIHAIDMAGQLSIAADRLAISQPAASRSLGEIETIVGAPVFERHPKGMVPTALGEVLSRRAGVLLGEIEEAESEVAALNEGRAGTVRVGAVTGAAVGYMVPAIHRLKAHSRNAEIRVTVAPSVQLMDELLSGDMDFILARVPSGIDSRRLEILLGRLETLSFLVRADHPLVSRRGVSLSDLRDFPWIIQERGMPIRDAIEAAHIRAGFPLPDNVVDSASLLMMLSFLDTSDAIAPVASEVADLFSASGPSNFAALDMKYPITMSPYHLIRQKGRPLGPIADRLLGFVSESLRD